MGGKGGKGEESKEKERVRAPIRGVSLGGWAAMVGAGTY